TREYLASHSDDLLLVRIGADRKEAVSFDVELRRHERATVTLEEKGIRMEGQLNDGNNGDKGVRYLTRLEMINIGGITSQEGQSLRVEGADEVLLLISTATDL